MRTHIFMTGEAGDHNLGDEGQALASASRLRRYFPDAELTATGLDPLGAVLRDQARVVPWPLLPDELHSSYVSRLGRRMVRKLGAPEGILDPIGRRMERIFDDQYRSNATFQSVLKEMEQADFIFDMGHGGLNDVFDPFMLCFFYYLAGRLGRPLFISGQSVGPLWRSRSIRMVRDTLSYAHTVGLRDKNVSYRVLVDEAGVDPEHVHLAEIGDDTLDLAPQEPSWQDFPPRLADMLRSGAFFAVQWRTSDYTQGLGATGQLVPLVDAIKHLHQATGLPAVFVPFSWELGAGDILTAARINDYLQGQTLFYVIWNYVGAPELKWLLGQARFGIGFSYHFNVFLLSQGIPSIGLYTNPYYEIKLRGAFAAYDYSGTPLAYPGELDVTESSFRQAVSLVTHWAVDEGNQLMTAAAAQNERWHEAFRSFLQDGGFIPKGNEFGVRRQTISGQP